MIMALVEEVSLRAFMISIATGDNYLVTRGSLSTLGERPPRV